MSLGWLAPEGLLSRLVSQEKQGSGLGSGDGVPERQTSSKERPWAPSSWPWASFSLSAF